MARRGSYTFVPLEGTRLPFTNTRTNGPPLVRRLVATRSVVRDQPPDERFVKRQTDERWQGLRLRHPMRATRLRSATTFRGFGARSFVMDGCAPLAMRLAYALTGAPTWCAICSPTGHARKQRGARSQRSP